MFGYMITTFAGFFWIFRLMVALLYTNETSFPIVPLNMTFEIVTLFIGFMCIILIAKKKMLGAVIYLITHCAYFGVDAYKTIELLIEGQAETSSYITLFISTIAVVIPILAIMYIGLDSGKRGNNRDKKTDWFYSTTEYERKMDNRADKNQYKF